VLQRVAACCSVLQHVEYLEYMSRSTRGCISWGNRFSPHPISGHRTNWTAPYRVRDREFVNLQSSCIHSHVTYTLREGFPTTNFETLHELNAPLQNPVSCYIYSSWMLPHVPSSRHRTNWTAPYRVCESSVIVTYIVRDCQASSRAHT